MFPAAPVLFSMTTGCPRLSLIFDPTRRATESSVPPAEKGTTITIGLAGNTCACAWVARMPTAMTIARINGVAAENRLEEGSLVNGATPWVVWQV